MGRRVYVKGKKTHAKGEGFAKELERKGRYFVQINLVSLSTITDYDLGNRGSEFYFKVGSLPHVQRTPTMGEINLQKNQSFTSNERLTLWSHFVKLEKDDSKEYKKWVKLFERDPDKDDLIAEQEVTIKLGAPSEYIILAPKDGKTKAKLQLLGSSTRY